MTSHTREIEFKFAVEGEQAFHQLVEYLHLPESSLEHGVTQTNHFFDSQARCLHKKHFAFRLRKEGNTHILTIKGKPQADDGKNSVLSDRVEEEVELSRETAQALLQGHTTPRQVIEEHFGDRSAPLLQIIAAACNQEVLVHIGEFENVRIHLPPVNLPLGETSTTVGFELDTSTFPDGNIDHEIEIEITQHCDAVSIEAGLIELFEQAGIEWHSAPSKAERFFSALSR